MAAFSFWPSPDLFVLVTGFSLFQSTNNPSKKGMKAAGRDDEPGTGRASTLSAGVRALTCGVMSSAQRRYLTTILAI